MIRVGQGHTWGIRKMHTGFWQKSLKEMTIWKPQRMWEYNDKMNFKAVEWKGLGFIHVAQVRKKMAATFEMLITWRGGGSVKMRGILSGCKTLGFPEGQLPS